MFEQIYQRSRVIERHRQAPLRPERERYLTHMIKEGYRHSTLTTAATYMLHTIRILELHELREVHEEEIRRGAEFWAGYRGPFRDPGHCHFGSPRSFIKYAHAWLRFHGKLVLSPDPPFHEQTQAFANALKFTYRLAAATVRGYSGRAQVSDEINPCEISRLGAKERYLVLSCATGSIRFEDHGSSKTIRTFSSISFREPCFCQSAQK